MIRKRSWLTLFRLLRPVLHTVLILLVFRLTYRLRLVTDLIPGLQLNIPWIDGDELLWYAVFASLTFVGIGFVRGLYELVKPLDNYNAKFLEVWFTWFVVISFVAYFGHGVIFGSGISRLIIVWSVGFVFILFLLVDRSWSSLLKVLQEREPYQVLCVYANESFWKEIEHRLFDENYYELYVLSLEDWHDINYNDYDIVVAVGNFDRQFLQSEYDQIRLAHHEFYHVSGSGLIDDIVHRPVVLGKVSAFRYSPTKLDGWQVVFKRMLDVGLGLFLLLLLSPLIVVIAICILIDSKGPVLYLQQRVGRNGKIFVFVKFRTMFLDLCTGEQYGGKNAWAYKQKLMASDQNIRQGELQKIGNDPRVTRVGRFFRRTSLDELPNLFSVIWGSMSLVGPRPHELFEVERYQHWQKRLLSVKPGMTGYAQIHGRDALSFEDEARYDLYYMQHWSLLLDAYVFLMTVKVVLKGR